mmetsp:Transcript_191/g.226  ORF Transcript_191/g.226 Transcript_191/m.226 type:complete len:89 (-) Transcript_191:15-281(-)
MLLNFIGKKAEKKVSNLLLSRSSLVDNYIKLYASALYTAASVIHYLYKDALQPFLRILENRPQRNQKASKEKEASQHRGDNYGFFWDI